MPEAAGDAVAAGGNSLFATLCRLQARFHRNAAGLPQHQTQRDLWSGVLIRVGEHTLLSPLKEIGEVLDVPREVTPVPATKDWVYGIANNRGTLLPLFDLRAFLFGSATRRGTKNRVLVVRRQEFPVGLLVDEVSGIRHIEPSLRTETQADLTAPLAPFVSAHFKLGSEIYPVFSMHRLTMDSGLKLTAA